MLDLLDLIPIASRKIGPHILFSFVRPKCFKRWEGQSLRTLTMYVPNAERDLCVACFFAVPLLWGCSIQFQEFSA